MCLTRRIVRLRNEPSRRAVLLAAGVEDELVSRHAHVAHRAGHVVRGAVDDEVSKNGLALPESAVERICRVQLVETVEEVLLGVWEQLL